MDDLNSVLPSVVVAAVGVDGRSQADGFLLHADRVVLARSHATWRGLDQERRRTGEQHQHPVNLLQVHWFLICLGPALIALVVSSFAQLPSYNVACFRVAHAHVSYSSHRLHLLTTE